MGNGQSASDVRLFNDKFAKRPNAKKQYENVIYDFLYTRYRMWTQYELFDFYLIDYNLFIEVDEEHHFKSDRSDTRKNTAQRDNNKMRLCLNKPASLLRLTWFTIINQTYPKLIQKCISKDRNGYIYLSSTEIYSRHPMLENINTKQICFLT